jgi:hypothetical protein
MAFLKLEMTQNATALPNAGSAGENYLHQDVGSAGSTAAEQGSIALTIG